MTSEFLDSILKSRSALLFLIAVNFAGFLFGVYYYMPQLDETPSIYWLLVIDCPLYVLLFSFVLAYELAGSPLPGALKFLTSVGLFKYGLWTVLVILLYFDHFMASAAFMYSFLFFLHLGMTAESVLAARMFKPSRASTAFVIAFFVACDVADYVFGLHPRIPETHLSLLFAESLLVSVAYPLLIRHLS